MDYKVLICSAGLGSRLKKYSKNLNKALATIDHKPVISHIIDKIPEDIEIVITLGHQPETIKEFISLAYPNRKVTYVTVDLYQGEGSGLGYSILQAKDELQCPFVLTTNDTLFTDEKLHLPTENYVYFSNVSEKYSDTELNLTQYRTIDHHYDTLIQLYDKGVPEQTRNIYTGLCGIKDYEKFWDYMSNGTDDGSIEIGDSYGVIKMVEEGIDFKAREIDWWDTGNVSAYDRAIERFQQDDHINILSKEEEDIWFLGDKVIKYHEDPSFIADRVIRTQFLGDYVPKITGFTKNMYMYEKVQGDTFTYNLKRDKFEDLLVWLKDFWQIEETKNASTKTLSKFYNSSYSFYKDRAYDRFELMLKKYKMEDKNTVINGKEYPMMRKLFRMVDWEDICDAVPGRFHGDLHFENIIVGKDGFGLIDWRQRFGTNKDIGDVYYDLAKLLHGLIISYEMVDNNLYEVNVSEDGAEVEYFFYQKNVLRDFETILEKFVVDELKLDYTKVKLICGMIFVNIAPLHQYPFCNLSYYLGKQMIGDILMEDN